MGVKIKPGRIKAHPLLNYVKKGLAAIDLMDGHGGEVRIVVAPQGVSPDTLVTIRVRNQMLVSSVVDPVMGGQVVAMSVNEKTKLALQYAAEAVLQGTIPHAKTEAEREKELDRQTKRVEDFFKRPGEVADYIWQILKDRPKAKMTKETFKSLGKFSVSVSLAEDVRALRQAGKRLAAEAIEIVKLILPN